MKYRPDIDGLRAVAVLSVFAYHLRPDLIPAGGLGVDIFFVISGYLIGGIILRESSAGSFSFLRFYERRLRRIGPALLASVLAVLVASTLLIMPAELENGGISAIAAILSASNLYFWHTIDYFNETAAGMPLLHTWSLGVEEQFYIAAPIILTVLVRYMRRWLWPILTVMLLVSLALNIWQVDHAPIDAFYLPQGRAWELLAGVLVNNVTLSSLEHRRLREALAWFGAVLIGGSLLLLDPELGWPGLAALPAVLGTALLILAGQKGRSLPGQILSLKPVTFIGLISYSLYLWHWPVIVFTREVALVDQLPSRLVFLVVVAAFIAAWLSWRFVERPFRRPEVVGGRALLGWTCGAGLLTLGFGALLIVSRGLPSRFDAETVRIAGFASSSEQNPWRHCILTMRDKVTDFDQTCLTPKQGKRSILLLGDSHANMFRPALDNIPGSAVMEASYAACAPDEALLPAGAATPCGRLLRKALMAARRNRPDLIVISWQVRRLHPEKMLALGELLGRLGAPILVIGPTPEYSVRVPKLIAAARLRGDPNLPARFMSRFLWPADARMAPLARRFASYLSPLTAMCDGRTCALWAGNEPAYYDRQHLDGQGARSLFNKMVAEQLSKQERQRLGLEDLRSEVPLH